MAKHAHAQPRVEAVPELDTDMLDVYYNHHVYGMGPGWGSGSHRVRRGELGQWVLEQLRTGPLLITAVQRL